MNMLKSTLPGGKVILGRVLNANGEPIDQKGSVENATRLLLSTPEELTKTVNAPVRMLETGIKTIDLMAPIAYGNVVGFIAGFGQGKDVVLEEIMRLQLRERQGSAVIVGMGETSYDASSLREIVREGEVEERVTMLFEQTTKDLSVHQRLLNAAVTIAAQFEGEGREVLLVIDSHIVLTEQIASLRRFANARWITTVIFVAVDDDYQPINQELVHELDVQLWFSQARAQQCLWPAIDPLASHSHLLESETVSQEHQQVAQQVRTVLESYYKLHDHVSSTEEDRQMLKRGERVELFFSQPFVVAEAFTDMPGAYLTYEETITDFRDLVDGRYDGRPVQAFKFVGRIE